MDRITINKRKRSNERSTVALNFLEILNKIASNEKQSSKINSLISSDQKFPGSNHLLILLLILKWA